MKTVSTVTHLLRNKDGEIGGLMLGDGLIVDTPAEQGETLKAMLKRGDVIRVEGDERRSRRGRVHLHARKISMPSRRIARMMAKTEEVSPLAEENGIVEKITMSRRGMVNGFRLTDGRVIKTPSRDSEKIISHIRNGDEVRVSGHWVVSRHGLPRLLAEHVHVHHQATSETGSRAEDLRLRRAVNLMTMADAILVELQRIRQELEALKN